MIDGGVNHVIVAATGDSCDEIAIRVPKRTWNNCFHRVADNAFSQWLLSSPRLDENNCSVDSNRILKNSDDEVRECTISAVAESGRWV